MDSSIKSVVYLLRDPDSFFECVRRGKTARVLSAWLATASNVCLAMFCMVVGLAHSPWQAVSSAIKMPILVMGAGLLCLPALYLFALVSGARLGMTQVAAVVLSGVGVTALLLMGLSPVIFIFVLTSHSYSFLQLLVVGSVALSGCIGVYYLWRGMERVNVFERASISLRRGMMSAWFILYAFVGSQMAWRLSPFVGDPAQPFVWLQPSRDNLYIDVIHALEGATGFEMAGTMVQPVWVGVLCVIPLALLVMGAGLAANSEEA
jgi:hypothetical protein